jgi:hypothetical protein
MDGDHSEDPGSDWRIILKWIFRHIQGFGGGKLRERDQLEDPDVDGRKDGSSGSGMWAVWTGSCRHRGGTGGGHL